MRTILFVFVTLVIGFAMCGENAVICYYGSWATYRPGDGKYDVENIDPLACTHLIYSFAGINEQGTVIALDPWLDLPDNWGRNNYGKFNALKEKNPSLKTLLAVGGWNEGSAKYSKMAADASLRKNFIDSAITMLSTHGFDGLDVDWEYPNRRDSVHGPADIDNFTKLLRELREAFDKHRFILSAAVAAVEDKAVLSYDVPAISRYLDIVNIMSYDMAGSWDSFTGHNSPLHKGEGYNGREEDNYTVELALQYWISAGCPPEKIALGIPFYARTFTLADPNNNGVRAPSTGAGPAGPYTNEAGFMGYNEFCYKMTTETWNKRFDNSAKVPYAFKDNYWVSYDDANSIAIKINYAKSLGINKMMVWSIETDDFHGVCGQGANPLLKAINNALKGNATPNNATDETEEGANTKPTASPVISTSTSAPNPTGTLQK
ncbi:acidic mammalian chitinase-like isoform X2 [Anticarsia gemmatalis]|uniref:acidic mammalian chitinase-like isoform X2 n=1 Tax=Anticarsia gemmatalis TaxID=129554 RepID=UPI003F76E6D9